MNDSNVVLERTTSESVKEVAKEKPSGQTENSVAQQAATQEPSTQEILVNMEIKDQNSALNCIIGYIGLAQRRGTFALDESAKLFECIKMFRQ